MLATGVTVTIREFVERAFAHVGVAIVWKGGGVDETGVCARTGKVLVAVSPEYFRPTEVELLLGDPTKAKENSGGRRPATSPNSSAK